MMKIEIKQNDKLVSVFENYSQDYILLNWDETYDKYMNESMYRFFNMKASLYEIFFNYKQIGHFTLFNLDENVKGVAMFCIRERSKMSLGEVLKVINRVKQFMSEFPSGVIGFCNTLRLVNFYSRLGFKNKHLNSNIHLIYSDKSEKFIENREFKEYF